MIKRKFQAVFRVFCCKHHFFVFLLTNLLLKKIRHHPSETPGIGIGGNIHRRRHRHSFHYPVSDLIGDLPYLLPLLYRSGQRFFQFFLTCTCSPSPKSTCESINVPETITGTDTVSAGSPLSAIPPVTGIPGSCIS